jgi:hypothetical protein
MLVGMDSSVADRRSAHLRVGAAATASFLILLLLLAAHGSSAADRASPAAAPALESTQPPQGVPADPGRGFRHRRDGFGPRGGSGGEPGFGGGGGGDEPGFGGGGSAPDGGVTPAPNATGGLS